MPCMAADSSGWATICISGITTPTVVARAVPMSWPSEAVRSTRKWPARSGMSDIRYVLLLLSIM